MKEVKIEKYIVQGEKTPIEVYQQTGIKFAFLSSPKDGNRQCHRTVLCRDFLIDVINAMVTDREVYVYNFRFKKGVNPPADLKRMRMLVQCPTNCSREEFGKKMKLSLNLIRYYEEMAGWMKSRLFRISNDEQLWLFVGPSQWLIAPVFISMYTFLIRLGYKDITSIPSEDLIKVYIDLMAKNPISMDNDIKYLRVCFDKLHLMIKERSKLFGNKISDNYPKTATVMQLHDFSGILSLSNFATYDQNLNERFRRMYKNAYSKSTQVN